MKTLKIDNIAKFLFLFLAIGLGYILQSCDDDPDKYESTGGVPEVFYIRMGNPEAADSLIEASYMETTICLVGNNLRSIREIYFNDQKAILNTSFITDHTLFVTIPKTIPTDVSNTMYMVAQKDTVKYPFSVLVPAPLVRKISNEYAHDNTEAILYGDYFIDDPSKPLTITMAGNIPVTEITSIEKTKVVFKVPEGAEKGYINVSSIYGTSRSKFQFRDDRGMILDWDNSNANGGWRAGNIRENDPVEGISGKYVYFAGDIPGDNSDWGEDAFSFNLWGTANGRPEGDLFDIDIETALLKFEINVPEAWSANALQMIFTPWGTTGTNGYIADGTTPRGLWYPWRETGSYTTDGWVTVSFPLKDFKYDHTGKELSVASPGNWGGLTFFVYHGGVEGTECSPKICIDNIRVVPAE
ncbi:MAG TPA: glycan-binding surface protein [Marinilabiliaceae bacterium]|nr:glycan-binding surface protein [Marinilabiliaceae bacterium]